MGLPWGLCGKETVCNAEHVDSIPGLRRSPGGEHGNTLKYSCLENPMDRGASPAPIPGVAQSRTGLE